MRSLRTAAALGLAAATIGLAGCPPAVPVQSAATVRAEDLPADPGVLAERAEELYRQGDPVSLENALVVLDKQISLQKGAYEPLWRAARAAFWVADFAEQDKTRRAEFAKKGVEYGRAAVAATPRGVEGHYFLALNEGYVVSTKGLGALGELSDALKEAKIAIEIDEKLDHAGPRRLAGALYVKAPGWPTSFGDVDEGLTHLTRAVEIDGAFAPNRIYYAEALLANDKCQEARKELAAASAAPRPEEAVWIRTIPRYNIAADELRQRIDQKCK